MHIPQELAMNDVDLMKRTPKDGNSLSQDQNPEYKECYHRSKAIASGRQIRRRLCPFRIKPFRQSPLFGKRKPHQLGAL
jgi:hypothetical protein